MSVFVAKSNKESCGLFENGVKKKWVDVAEHVSFDDNAAISAQVPIRNDKRFAFGAYSLSILERNGSQPGVDEKNTTHLYVYCMCIVYMYQGRI